MRFKAEQQYLDYRALSVRCPALQMLLCSLDGYIRQVWDTELTITSIYRQDTTVHGLWRAADCRIEFNRDDDTDDIHWDNWEVIASRYNSTFLYGKKTNGMPSKCIHLLDKDTPNQHAHIQVPGGKWQGERV